MRRVTLLVIFSILVLVSPDVRSQSSEPESEAIRLARDIAAATERLVETKQANQVAALRAISRQPLRRLRQMGNPAVEELREAIHMKGSYVAASSAAYALWLLDPSQVDTAVEALMMQANRMMFTDDMLAQRLIMAIGAPAVPTLAHHLNDSMVIQLLGAMGNDAASAVDDLKGVLGTKNVEVAATLAAIGTSAAIEAAMPILMDALEDPNNPHAPTAIIALGNLRKRASAAIQGVRKALRSKNPDTRLHAAVALADIGDTAYAVGALSNLIQEKELHGRYAAIQKLRSLGAKAKAAIPVLVSLILDNSDQQYGDRAAAAMALTKIAPNSALTKAIVQRALSQSKLRVLMEKQGLPLQQ